MGNEAMFKPYSIVNWYVIKIDGNLFYSDQIGENSVHQGLKDSERVSQTKKYYLRFKQFSIDGEGSLSLISFLNMNIIITSINIEHGEILSLPQATNDIGGKETWVAIFYHKVVQFALILDQVQVPIFFFDEEIGKGNQRL